MIGTKLGMTQVWGEGDRLVPCTVIEAGPCLVAQRKTVDRDGYDAVQLAYGQVKATRVNRPKTGHFAKAGIEPKRWIREMRLGDGEEYEVGQEIKVDVFEVGSSVDITGTSKGKGFQGVIKRHNYHGGPGGHGSHFHRQPGSIGQCATPSRVFKGLGLPGHMGSDTVTVKNLEVLRVDPEQNLMVVKGAVPGGKGSLLTIRGR